MTAITYDGAVPTVGADADTWGGELNTGALAKIKVDLDMLNASPTASILGRVTAGTGEVERLTGAQAATILPAVVGDSGSGGTKGLVPAPAAGDAAAGKVLTAAGTWGASDIKAWGRTTPAGLQAGRNVASAAYTGTGAYTVTFTTALASAAFGVTFGYEGAVLAACRVTDGSKTTGGFQFTVISNAGSPIDPTAITFSVLG